ncbi:hypothetical protein AVEN_97935-1 [Araneus ventricosus]|uniref:PiggyBac transposable element-derived protein domain-containing protein n=1 Tax=Araneus ventricosus TaxID=182803 RepID=A0A4Y2K0E7_ARAVE|nr:hypothetical protein AVEN_97935-1 [Araneus ventricosus]
MEALDCEFESVLEHDNHTSEESETPDYDDNIVVTQTAHNVQLISPNIKIQTGLQSRMISSKMAIIEGEKVYRKEWIIILMSSMPYDKSIGNRLNTKPEMILEYSGSKGSVDTRDQLLKTYL